MCHCLYPFSAERFFIPKIDNLNGSLFWMVITVYLKIFIIKGHNSKKIGLFQKAVSWYSIFRIKICQIVTVQEKKTIWNNDFWNKNWGIMSVIYKMFIILIWYCHCPTPFRTSLQTHNNNNPCSGVWRCGQRWLPALTWHEVRGVRGIFFRWGKINFPDFFLARKFPFWYTQNKLQWFWNEVKIKKRKKKQNKTIQTKQNKTQKTNKKRSSTSPRFVL